MIRLNFPTVPHDIDLGFGVIVHVLPLTTATMAAIRADLASVDASADASNEALHQAFVRAAARVAVQSWTGVHDADDEPAAVTPAAVDALMDVFQMFDRFAAAYVAPRMLIEEEKKSLSGGLNGTSAVVPPIAPDAPPAAPPAPLN
jgi:hypothetical protein